MNSKRIEVNRFGEGRLYQENELEYPVHAVCTACMSVYADYLSWANMDYGQTCTKLKDAQSIIVLSCQVTSDAILNDLRTAEALRDKYPDAQVYIGGCLARRFDIELPERVRRVGDLRADGTHIHHKDYVTFMPPFWVSDFDEKAPETKDGSLFRHMYPLRLSVGCAGKCSYCTINTTRGKTYHIDRFEFQEEFETAIDDRQDILLVSDAPTVDDLHRAFGLVLFHNYPVSIRNVEPAVTVQCRRLILNVAERGLLKVFHTPVQHTDLEVLKDMGRNTNDYFYTLDVVNALKHLNVYTATNIITQYKDRLDPDIEFLRTYFDYISWNAYWDGIWNRKEAEDRFDRLFSEKKEYMK